MICILLLWKQARYDDPVMFKATGASTCVDMAKSWYRTILARMQHTGTKRKKNLGTLPSEPSTKKQK